jgi:hypothetical protein
MAHAEHPQEKRGGEATMKKKESVWLVTALADRGGSLLALIGQPGTFLPNRAITLHDHIRHSPADATSGRRRLPLAGSRLTHGRIPAQPLSIQTSTSSAHPLSRYD